MSKREVVDGARVERRKPRTPEEVERGYLEAAEKTRRRGAMLKLTGESGGRAIWNALIEVQLAIEQRGSTRAAVGGAERIDNCLHNALAALEGAVSELGGSALLAAPAGAKDGADHE